MKKYIRIIKKKNRLSLIVALFLLIYVGIMINVMVREYGPILMITPMCHSSLEIS